MRDVLVVTSTFPPTADSGVFRITKFVKYLPSCGWRPIVLRVHPQRTRPRDESLLAEIPPEAIVVRGGGAFRAALGSAAARLTRRPVLRGDWGRFKAATRIGVELCRTHPIELIFLSAPPDRLPVLGLWLQRATGLPLVVDFRDPPWQLNASWRPTSLERAYFDRVARELWDGASRLIANTEPVRQEMIDRYSLPSGKVLFIPNGFDEADFRAVSRDTGPRDPARLLAVSIGAPRPGRELEAFAAALASACQDGNFRARFRLRVHGRRFWFLREALASRGLADLVEFTDHVEHLDAVRAALGADLNVVFFQERTSQRRVPQKLYTYLRAGRPVLAFLGPGPGARIIEETGLGAVCDPLDPQAMADGLRLALERWRQGWQPGPIPQALLDRYERSRLTAALAGVFAEVTASKPMDLTR
jgi:glycosyltransferase involved in cell wall biosynthesis